MHCIAWNIKLFLTDKGPASIFFGLLMEKLAYLHQTWKICGLDLDRTWNFFERLGPRVVVFQTGLCPITADGKPNPSRFFAKKPLKTCSDPCKNDFAATASFGIWTPDHSAALVTLKVVSSKLSCSVNQNIGSRRGFHRSVWSLVIHSDYRVVYVSATTSLAIEPVTSLLLG